MLTAFTPLLPALLALALVLAPVESLLFEHHQSLFPEFPYPEAPSLILNSDVRPNSNSESWSIRYDDGTTSEFTEEAQSTSDGGVVVVSGTSLLSTNNSYDGAVLKLDSLGVPQWHRVFSPGPTTYDYLHTIRETRDGGFIAAGMTWRFPDNGHDTWVIKLDSQGVPEWEKVYRVYGSIYRYSQVRAMVETHDGGFLLVGYGYGGYNRDDALVIKLRPDGSVVWHKLWGDTYASEYAYAAMETSSGNIAVVGNKGNFGFVTMFDRDGIPLWQNDFTATPNELNSVTESLDGKLVVAGAVFDLEFDPQWNTWERRAWDALVMKLDPANGAILWQRTYGAHGDEWVSSIAQLADGDITIGGTTDSFGNGLRDSWLASVRSSDGAILWEKSYGGQASEDTTTLISSGTDSLIIASTVYDPDQAASDLWILKVNRRGECTICNLEEDTSMVSTNRTLSGRSFRVSERTTTIIPIAFSSSVLSADISMRLACPGVLDVELFLQTSPSWKHDPFGSPPDGPNETIGNLGCYVASAAMLINFHAEQQSLAFRTDPGLLNDWLRENGKYPGNSFYHPTAAEYARNFGVELYAPNPWRLAAPNDDLIRTSLQSGHPVILEVPAAESPSGSHFVVVVGETTTAGNNTYILNDPIFGFTTLREKYANQYLSIRAYNPWRPDDLRSITVSAHSPIEIVVEDNIGRRTGYDPTSGTTWNQIPGAVYYIETIASQDAPRGESGASAKFLYIPQPIDDDYIVTVFGTASGDYELNALATTSGGATQKRTYQGQAQIGSTRSITVTYAANTGWDLPFRNYLPLITRW